LEQSFTARMPLLTVTTAFRLGEHNTVLNDATYRIFSNSSDG